MEKTLLTINISPREAYDVLLESKLLGEVKFKDSYDVDGKEIVITVFEEYFFRTSNRGSLTVVIENTEGITKVKASSTGTSQGMFFSFDWGASYSYVEKVCTALKEHTIDNFMDTSY